MTIQKKFKKVSAFYINGQDFEQIIKNETDIYYDFRTDGCCATNYELTNKYEIKNKKLTTHEKEVIDCFFNLKDCPTTEGFAYYLLKYLVSKNIIEKGTYLIEDTGD